jgi:hypothetical protein
MPCAQKHSSAPQNIPESGDQLKTISKRKEPHKQTAAASFNGKIK